MKYMLLICGDDSADASAMAPVEPWVEEMGVQRGVRLHGDRLRPADEATTVRVRGGDRLVSDGPFAETKEQVAGYDVIECDTLDEAIEVAAKHPVATIGAIEVRPYWDEPGLAEAAIRGLEDEITEAIRERDVDRLVACHAPDVETYDAMGALTSNGVEAYRNTQEWWFSTLRGQVRRDIHDLRLHIGENVAFGHTLVRVRSTLTSGEELDAWMRLTTGYRKPGDRWLVAHQHVSVPFEAETGRAATGLRP